MENKFEVMDFYADWCTPCKNLSPIFESVSENFNDIKFSKVNVDNETERAVSNNVRSLPTLLFFKDGVEMDRSIGYISKDDLISKIEKLKNMN